MSCHRYICRFTRCIFTLQFIMEHHDTTHRQLNKMNFSLLTPAFRLYLAESFSVIYQQATLKRVNYTSLPKQCLKRINALIKSTFFVNLYKFLLMNWFRYLHNIPLCCASIPPSLWWRGWSWIVRMINLWTTKRDECLNIDFYTW